MVMTVLSSQRISQDQTLAQSGVSDEKSSGSSVLGLVWTVCSVLKPTQMSDGQSCLVKGGRTSPPPVHGRVVPQVARERVLVQRFGEVGLDVDVDVLQADALLSVRRRALRAAGLGLHVSL
jgi:hypothetical protein